MAEGSRVCLLLQQGPLQGPLQVLCLVLCRALCDLQSLSRHGGGPVMLSDELASREAEGQAGWASIWRAEAEFMVVVEKLVTRHIML